MCNMIYFIFYKIKNTYLYRKTGKKLSMEMLLLAISGRGGEVLKINLIFCFYFFHISPIVNSKHRLLSD